MTPLTLTVLGDAVPFARTRRSKSGALFTPPRQRNAMALLRVVAQQEMLHGNRKPFDAAIRVTMLVEVAIPASWSEKKRQAAIRGEVWPAKRPDIDNLYKLVADACNGVVWRDDALVVALWVSKRYGPQPKVVITVQPLMPG